MHHENPLSLTFKALIFRIHQTDILTVAISVDAFQRLECGNRVCEIDTSAEISGMPHLIHRLQKLLEFRTEHAVRI